MLTSLFSVDRLITILLRLPAVLLAISVHESAHAWTADKLGDPTGRVTGRISINPMRHFDLYGTLCMVLFGFGWAKPVPINPRNFKDPKKGMAISAAAGPVSNVLMMLVGILLERVLEIAFSPVFAAADSPFYMPCAIVLTMVQIFSILNASLAVFNLIPVPPLDGSRLLLVFLPQRLYFKLMQYERWIMLGMMALLFLGVLDGPLSFLSGGLYSLGNRLVGLIPFL